MLGEPPQNKESQQAKQKVNRQNLKEIGETNLLLLLRFYEVVRVLIMIRMIDTSENHNPKWTT